MREQREQAKEEKPKKSLYDCIIQVAAVARSLQLLRISGKCSECLLDLCNQRMGDWGFGAPTSVAHWGKAANSPELRGHAGWSVP